MSLPKTYAKALYESAQDAKSGPDVYDLLEKQMDTFVSVVESSKELTSALYGPVATAREKSAIVSDLSKHLKFSDLLNRFLLLLIKKRRLGLIDEIRQSFHAVRLTFEGGLSGELVSAEPLEQSDIDGLAQAFEKKLGKKVVFHVTTEPELLAGMKVTVNGVTYDGTLRSQLVKLKDQFTTTDVSGRA